MKNEQEFFKTNQDNVLVRIARLEQKTTQLEASTKHEISQLKQRLERLEQLEGIKNENRY